MGVPNHLFEMSIRLIRAPWRETMAPLAFAILRHHLNELNGSGNHPN